MNKPEITAEITTEMLHAFVDGQLNDADMDRVESYLADNPERAAEVGDWAMQNDAICGLYPANELPIELPEIPIAANSPRAPLSAIAASIAILAFGVMIGWLGRGAAPQNTEISVAGLVQEAITAHAVYTADASRPVEIRADQEELLIGWLSKRVGERLSAPDLSAKGYDLVGGRLLPSSDGPAAQFMYENAQGLRITLFAARSDGSLMAEFTFQENGKTNSFYWQDEKLRYALVGDLPHDSLNALAIAVYQAFS